MSVAPVDFDLSFTDHGHGLSTTPTARPPPPGRVSARPASRCGLNRGIAHALAEQGFRVALLDLLGHGRSDKPTHASNIASTAMPTKCRPARPPWGGKTVLGGISLGANVSLFAATRYPERAQALVLEMPVLERAVPAAALVFVPWFWQPTTDAEK